jgi:hypothetical protein
MEKIYQIKYIYAIIQEDFVNEYLPDLGVRKTTSLTERIELVAGKSPVKALKNWKKISKGRGEKNRAYVIDISEYKIEATEGEK